MSSQPDLRLLSRLERSLFALIGILMLGAALASWRHPAERIQVVEHAQVPPYTTTASADPAYIVASLMTIGCAFLFVSINGLRVAKFKIPGAHAEALGPEKESVRRTFTRVGEVPPDGVAAEDPAPTQDEPLITPATTYVLGEELGVYRLSDTPTRVLQDLISSKEWEDGGYGTLDTEFIARRMKGKGNHAWFFKFHNRDSLWKLTRGGQGKTGPTIKIIPTRS